MDVTNAFQNTLKSSSKKYIIDCPPHYTAWFKLRVPTIWIEPTSYGRYAIEIYRRMQGTKNYGCQWNTILNLVLSSLGFVKHVIYHALYILHKKCTNDVLIVGCSTEDFLCAYDITHIFRYFLSGINKYLHVNPKEGPELSYINLWIIQSPYGTIIDQADHIKTIILAQWFPDATERVKYSPNLFKSDRTFELDLAETLTDTLSDLHHLEERYLGKFSANIGKPLQIMQHTHPDIIYALKRLYIYATVSSAPAFQGINYLIRHLDGFYHRPFMYPYVIYGTTTHELHQDIYPGEFHFKNIRNTLVDFSGGGEGCTLNNKRDVAFIILCIFGIAIHWSAKNQPDSTAHSIYPEVRTFYLATIMVQ